MTAAPSAQARTRREQARRKQPSEGGGNDEITEDEQDAGDAHRRRHDERERPVEDHVPQKDLSAQRSGKQRIERHLDEGAAEDEVHGADRAVEKGEHTHLMRRHGEDRADEKLLDVLRPLRRAIEREHAERSGHRVNDADDRLLLQRFLVRPHQREEHRPADCKGERVPVTGLALHGMAGEDRDGQAEGRNLRKRKIDEDHAPSEDVQAEISVDPGEDEARDEWPKQQL